MEHQTFLGKSNLRVPRMGIGAMVWGDPKGLARLHPAKTAYGGAHGIDEERRAVDVSIEAGVNLFDTAAMYSMGAAESRLGELTRGKDVIIATKYPSGFSFKVEDFPKELAMTLTRLRRDSIDLYQHHYPNVKSIPDLMNRVADAVEAGKIKAVGVSNYSVEQMREAHASLAKRGIPLASNQVEYSLLNRKPEVNGIMDACRELGIMLIAYTPLAGGRLTGKYSAQDRPSGFFRRILPQYNRKALEEMQPVINLLREIGERYSKTPSQVALRWLIENPIVLPIPGAKNGKQAADNAEALKFSLTAEEVEMLSQATMRWRK
ncbi:MAG TPA: aldo/keto reductase [Anaerolineales bacterium]|nr:aldo/keto reductase [Anaerolineales bacterium]HMR99647.1 aldo/keto reductase [Anaerolineales bacterium]HNQ95344.1 aldo/keto reductase [Anaerolineales bacterium]HNS61990.1 aldo/keto reductase [Anaerolineales bacterium]